MGRSAAFFDLDKTVIAKSSALAFGRPFYRDGLITRRDVVKSAYAQLMFRLGGTDEQTMAKTRDYLAALCKGWQVEQVRQIVAETLHELINPYVYAEAAALIEQHQAAGRDVVLVSASGEEMVRPIGELLGITDVIATRMAVANGRYSGEVEFYAAGPSKVEAVSELARQRGYDLADSYAYSDSMSDRPLLECVGHPSVAEAAVVGATDPTTGQAIVAFAIPRGSVDAAGEAGEQLIADLRNHVARTLGPIAKPRQIMLVPELPKTRSGKIMRRLLRDVAENRSLGDVTTLQDSSVMELISSGMGGGKSDED
ncbi:HAD-IB family hydrolase [Micromonospora sp. DH15]|nr:HAD-IB family hydrolase [Micromonospora sp. DH15]